VKEARLLRESIMGSRQYDCRRRDAGTSLATIHEEL